MSDDVHGAVSHAGSAGLGAPPGWIARRRGRRPGARWLLASRVVLVVLAAITLMVVALAVGMRLDDRQIERHLATATATVLSISPLRTGIEFVDGAGATIRPSNGVMYPGRLSVGQRFMVEYSTLDPSVVRVAGRTAAVGNISLAATLLVTALVGLVVVGWLRRRFRRARQPAR